MTDATAEQTGPSRFERGEFWALVAEDNFDALAERVRAMLMGQRRMVLIHRYGRKDSADVLDIKVGLRLDTGHGGPFEIRHDQYGRHFHVRLAPGINGIGFSAPTGSTERAMHSRYDARGEA